LVTPGSRLVDADRAAIRRHLPALKRLVSTDYTHYPDRHDNGRHRGHHKYHRDDD